MIPWPNNVTHVWYIIFMMLTAWKSGQGISNANQLCHKSFQMCHSIIVSSSLSLYKSKHTIDIANIPYKMLGSVVATSGSETWYYYLMMSHTDVENFHHIFLQRHVWQDTGVFWFRVLDDCQVHSWNLIKFVEMRMSFAACSLWPCHRLPC